VIAGLKAGAGAGAGVGAGAGSGAEAMAVGADARGLRRDQGLHLGPDRGAARIAGAGAGAGAAAAAARSRAWGLPMRPSCAIA